MGVLVGVIVGVLVGVGVAVDVLVAVAVGVRVGVRVGAVLVKVQVTCSPAPKVTVRVRPLADWVPPLGSVTVQGAGPKLSAHWSTGSSVKV